MPFGEALRIAGGTLGQLLMPVICAVALHRRGDNFGAAICLAWMGMSLMDASVYAYDAADPLLPLIGAARAATASTTSSSCSSATVSSVTSAAGRWR